MKYQIKADLCPQCAAFLSEKFPRIEFRHLQYIRVCDSTKSFVTAGVWGSCSYPSKKANVDYRICFCVSLSSSDFPYPAKFAIGTRRFDAMRWEWFWRDFAIASSSVRYAPRRPRPIPFAVSGLASAVQS